MNALEIVKRHFEEKGKTARYFTPRVDNVVEVGVGSRVVEYYIVKDNKIVSVVTD
jgi:hypothetical protein